VWTPGPDRDALAVSARSCRAGVTACLLRATQPVLAQMVYPAVRCSWIQLRPSAIPLIIELYERSQDSTCDRANNGARNYDRKSYGGRSQKRTYQGAHSGECKNRAKKGKTV